MSHQVCILWFKNADTTSRNDYHWSLFIAPVNSSNGVKYDALSSTNSSGVLQWDYSHLPGYEIQQSLNFGDVIMLGSISDIERFKAMMLATPLPSVGENCQSWIRQVVQEVVRQGMLPASATAKVETVPIRP
jgi:hypothetical protein